MLLVFLQDIRVEVEDRTLFEIKNLSIHQGDRIGLVGRNGSGKTSLLEVIAGERETSAGIVTLYGSVTLIPQLKPKMDKKSGGEISQMVINQMLSRKQDVLLADEPTTHLDAEHLMRLEQQLQNRQEAMVIVSHDRVFLDAICNKIWEIEDGTVRVYSGNYSDYVYQKQEKLKHHNKEYEKFVQKKKQLEAAMREKEQKAQRATKKPKKLSASEARIKGGKPYFAKKQKKLNQGAKAIQTRIEKLEKVEKIKEAPPIKMEVIHQDSLKKRIIIRGEKVRGEAGKCLLWKEFDFSIIGGDKIGIIGANGSGKTTFLRKILDQSEGISISPAVSFGYFSQMLEILNHNASIIENVQNTSCQDQTLIRTVLARLGFFRDDIFKSVNVLSGGERVKVAFGKLFVSDANVLILDEPTNFLDVEAVEALESLLNEYSGTVLLVTHDRRLLENVATRIFSIKDKRIDSYDGTFREYIIEEPKEDHNPLEDELLKVDTKISEVLSRLSIQPSQELEQEFQTLLRQKKGLMRRLDASL
ncbi:ribosomal protection-like ABC-F family protein [Bacillus kwashiorkori]|uniref:ribosomal protection-like ABC-F family protein n=1 Tax=Bacillus kwashiorkori TaxID=1522318 RepID=UPI000781C83D|nr:ABC-F type ribosomal protection protein [Bacillus kwashiorkori]